MRRTGMHGPKVVNQGLGSLDLVDGLDGVDRQLEKEVLAFASRSGTRKQVCLERLVASYHALCERERIFRGFVENTPDVIIVVNNKGTVLFVNHMVQGLAQEEVAGTSAFDYIPPNLHERYREALERVFQKGRADQFEHAAAGSRWWVVRVAPIKSGRNVLAAVMVFTDITERKQAEDALLRSENLFRGIYEESPIAIEVNDAEGRLIGVNRASLEMFGLSTTEDISYPGLFADPRVPEDAKQRLRGGHTVRYDLTVDFDKSKKSGLPQTTRSGIAYLDVVVSALHSERTNSIEGYLVQIQDITRHRRMQESLRELSRRLVEVQEMERRHISRELHDQIGQSLTGLRIQLEMAARESAQELEPRLRQALQLINELMIRVRDLSVGLRPSMLDDLGLRSALRSLFERYSAQTGVKVAFEEEGEESVGRRFRQELEITAYRIVQEALTNIARHANVDEARVRLSLTRDALVVQIEDCGEGFDSDRALANSASSGLIGMRERAMSVGGRLRVDSAPGIGTKVVAQLPLRDSH